MKKEDLFRFFYVISAMLVVGFCIAIYGDYIQYNSSYTSAPFDVNILFRTIEFILPSIILFTIGKIFKRKYNK